MHRASLIKLFGITALLFTGAANAQSEVINQMGRVINDALFYSDKYITPAADAAVYQSASGWMDTPKEREAWDVTLSVHVNVFFTPQRDREFTIYNNDFTFFQLEEGTSAVVPTALGNDYQVYLSGMLGDDELRLETPEGVNRETVPYPYFQGSVAVGYGTEVVAKYSPKVNFRDRSFQVYGVGIKHNFSRYFSSLAEKKIHLAALVAFSKEEVSSNFLNVQTDYGTLGLNTINADVDTWQFQVNGSKEFGRFEAMAGLLLNRSELKFNVSGEKGGIEAILPLQETLNKRLEEIYKTRVNCIAEASLSYNMGHFDLQTILAFGQFVNGNISLHYTF